MASRWRGLMPAEFTLAPPLESPPYSDINRQTTTHAR